MPLSELHDLESGVNTHNMHSALTPITSKVESRQVPSSSCHKRCLHCMAYHRSKAVAATAATTNVSCFKTACAALQATAGAALLQRCLHCQRMLQLQPRPSASLQAASLQRTHCHPTEYPTHWSASHPLSLPPTVTLTTSNAHCCSMRYRAQRLRLVSLTLLTAAEE